jgi:MSHA biogenesis protein MshK
MNDPMRPPAGFGVVAESGGGDAVGGMTLQSVMISPSQKSAIINGQVVKLGERYGDAVLVRVAENEVVLKGPSASRVLKLHPGVDRRDGAATNGVGVVPRKAAGRDGLQEEKRK